MNIKTTAQALGILAAIPILAALMVYSPLYTFLGAGLLAMAATLASCFRHAPKA